MEVFQLILTQNAQMAQAMTEMQAPADRVAQGVNLKSMSAPLPVDRAALAATRTALNGRPVWVASSTHEGEEAQVLEAHKLLLAEHPDLCTQALHAGCLPFSLGSKAVKLSLL